MIYFENSSLFGSVSLETKITYFNNYIIGYFKIILKKIYRLK